MQKLRCRRADLRSAGVVITARGRPYSLMGFIAAGGKIVEIDAIIDPKCVAKLASAVIR